jgi:hypothetical protein
MKGGARTEKKKTPKTPKFRLTNSAYGKKTRKSIKSSVKTSHPEAYLKNIQSYLTSILNQVDSGYLSEKAFENYTAIAMAIVEETTPVVGNIGKTIQVNENENDVFKYIESLHSIIDELIDEYNSNLYQKKRSQQYPRITDQLDMLWHEINNNGSLSNEGEWFNRIKAVKEDNPKN